MFDYLLSPTMIIILIAIIALSVISNLLNTNRKISYPYTKAKLMTKNESAFFIELEKIANTMNFYTITKVRMADIVDIKKGISNSERTAAFNRIKSKHIDFLLLNKTTLEIACAIELDDSSHDKEKAKKNDEFKNKTFEIIGIKLIRTRTTAGLREKILAATTIKKD